MRTRARVIGWMLAGLIAIGCVNDSRVMAETSDAAIHRKSRAAAPPASGSTFVDPTFGARITRVTDPQIAPSGANVNSGATDSMFNAKASMFYVLVEGGALFFHLDRDTGRITALGRLQGSLDGAPWDPTDPTVLYTIGMNTDRRELSEIRLPLPGTTVTLHDFSSEIPPGGYPSSRVQVSPDSRFFAVVASTTGGQDTYDYVAVWDRRTGQTKVLNTRARLRGATLHSMILDNSGRFAIVQSGDYSTRYVWEWATDTLEGPLVNGAPDYFGGHLVPGSSEVINPPGISTTNWAVRSLKNPHAYSPMLTFPLKDGKTDWFEDNHSTRLLSDGKFFTSLYVGSGFSRGRFVRHAGAVYKLVGYLSLDRNFCAPDEVRYSGSSLRMVDGIPSAAGQWSYDSAGDTLYLWLPDGADPETKRDLLAIFDWRPLMDEIVEFSRVGESNLAWRRLAHHRSQYHGWNTDPRVNADPSGSFVLFQSNWDGSPRVDVFLLRVPAH